MNASKKDARINLRVSDEAGLFVKRLAVGAGMTDSAIASMIFHAAIEAAIRHGSPLPFPLRLEVVEQRAKAPDVKAPPDHPRALSTKPPRS